MITVLVVTWRRGLWGSHYKGHTRIRYCEWKPSNVSSVEILYCGRRRRVWLSECAACIRKRIFNLINLIDSDMKEGRKSWGMESPDAGPEAISVSFQMLILFDPVLNFARIAYLFYFFTILVSRLKWALTRDKMIFLYAFSCRELRLKNYVRVFRSRSSKTIICPRKW